MSTSRPDRFDVVVAGAGATGVAAALASAEAGARTALVEAAPFLGGELVSGLPILGTRNTAGDRIVGGPLDRLEHGCRELGGYIGDLFDWRTMWGTCLDPETLKLVIVERLAASGVVTLPSAQLTGVNVGAPGTVDSVVVNEKASRRTLSGRVFVDATGDATLAHGAGADVVEGDGRGGFQPVSLVFRMTNVDFNRLLNFIADHPDEFMLSENSIIEASPEECAANIKESGKPYVAMTAERPTTMMARAIQEGSLYPTTGIWMWPTSIERRELGFNTTRVGHVNAMDSAQIGRALSELTAQVRTAIEFMRKNIAGFEDALFAGAASKVGVRETRRILGESELSAEDVVAGRKRDDGIAKGGHHIDIHGNGTFQKRVPVTGGKSFDIPFGSLVPVGVRNVLVAGRPVSSSRDANGSVRVMGTCMATGQAAGTAAAICSARAHRDVRDVSIADLRNGIRAGGGIIDGTR